ncbi:MAG TPA: penicillin-binding protein activator [Rhizomicrobium sp.]|jgi:ABC-type branched-subunit amino acid transport system substrate-binding protein|nr:penicillin-binding protein activator [Rhizomicrobium sp.]
MRFSAPSRFVAFSRPLCAIAAVLAITALAGCATQAPPPPQKVVEPAGPPPGNPITSNQPEFLRLPNMPADQTPVRVGLILPFSSKSPGAKALADAMSKAAQLALFDAGKSDILLITADEGNGPADAAAAARKLLAQGAEVIVGPVFAASVSAVTPIAHDRGVPVIAFSSDRSVAGKGAYLLSFQPESEVKRIVAYAASQGHANFAALVPETPYGAHIGPAFKDDVTAVGAKVADVSRFAPSTDGLDAPAKAVIASNPDAVLIAQGGPLLRALAPTLVADGLDHDKVKLLGTSVWNDPAIQREPMLEGGWFAAPEPDADAAFIVKYKNTFGNSPPQLATLAYDAISLVALLSPGTPYQRFTDAALTDPNGFTGADGIFRFTPDGTAERGLAVMAVTPEGFTVVSPAPKTFQPQGS